MSKRLFYYRLFPCVECYQSQGWMAGAESAVEVAYAAGFMAAVSPKKKPRRRRIGLFGGTFDPPHLGHLVVAEAVRDQLDLDEVRMVVANEPWQKAPDRSITDALVRLEMVEAALGRTSGEPAPGLVASAVEIERGGPSYTIDTLDALRAAEPETKWLVVVGADAAAGLDTWHRAADLARVAEIVVVNRSRLDPQEDEAVVPPGWQWSAVDIPTIGISSTEIRARVAEQRSIRFLTPNSVVSIIERAGLYQDQHSRNPPRR